MTEQPVQPLAQQDDAVALLVRAVNQLPPDDRDEVFAWLLRLGGRHYSPAGAAIWGRERASAGLLDIFQEAKSASARQPGSAQQMVPVRFPADQHARLREWCTEHGFSMATVIRGLVTKFLDGQFSEHN
jgi:hypothetical protein